MNFPIQLVWNFPLNTMVNYFYTQSESGKIVVENWINKVTHIWSINTIFRVRDKTLNRNENFFGRNFPIDIFKDVEITVKSILKFSVPSCNYANR